MTRFHLVAIALVTLSIPCARSQTATPAKAPAERLDGPPLVSAKAWVVADGKTGKVLWGADEAAALPMASTTKIMTARLVLSNPKALEETLTVSERAAKTGGSSAKLQAGDKYAVRDLLYGLLLPSGNDAATALAEHFGPRFANPGDKPAADPAAPFVAAMNKEAEALGMKETRYLDPHGLGANKTSARDLAKLTHATMADERFRKYVASQRHECEVVGADGAKRTATWVNTNKLLAIEGYDGVKTGTTTAAGACLVASGHRGGDRLIVVILGGASAEGRYTDARNLFRWAWKERLAKP